MTNKMPSNPPKYLVGLVGPEVLEAAEKDLFHPVRLDLDCCGALEIRYDFFDESLWASLSKRVRNIAPGKLPICGKKSLKQAKCRNG